MAVRTGVTLQQAILRGMLALALSLIAHQSQAETLPGALLRAFASNPGLNAGRAGLRATDENVAIAQSGYRPIASLSSVTGITASDLRSRGGVTRLTDLSIGGGLNVSQTVFNGFVTDNLTRRAQSGVFATREDLRFTEGATLFNAAQAYMNVLQSTATVELQRNFVVVLQEQVRQTLDRFRSGEVTRTDVSQSQARLAGARYQLGNAEAILRTNAGIYRQVIGSDPRLLAPGQPIDRYVPQTLDAALATGAREHPQILSALHALDVAESQVKVLEGRLYPQANLNGTLQQSRDIYLSGGSGAQSNVGAITGSLAIPLYQGGGEYAQIRAAKELVAQARVNVEQVRDFVRADITRAWGVLEASKGQIQAFQVQILADEIALGSVREEASVGQRTTLDVLNAQQELLSARNNFILAQRDRVLGTYDVVLSIGRLTASMIGVSDRVYDVKRHFDQVKDLWAGLDTPGGR